jgi:hypothetical protein
MGLLYDYHVLLNLYFFKGTCGYVKYLTRARGFVRRSSNVLLCRLIIPNTVRLITI